MTLTNIGPLFGDLLKQLRELAAATDFIAVHWSSGDMPRQFVLAVEQRAGTALETLAQIRTEFARPGVAATASSVVASYNWTGTLGELNTGLNAIEAAILPWQNRVISEDSTVSLVLVDVTQNGATYKQTRFNVNFPEAVGIALKNSAELAAMRTALSNLGIPVAS